MKTVTTQEAAEHFENYARLAHSGEKVLVTRNGEPWVMLSRAALEAGIRPGENGLKWPDFAARVALYYPVPVSGPTATELLAQDKEDPTLTAERPAGHCQS
jgi:hypothetical protein